MSNQDKKATKLVNQLLGETYPDVSQYQGGGEAPEAPEQGGGEDSFDEAVERLWSQLNEMVDTAIGSGDFGDYSDEEQGNEIEQRVHAKLAELFTPKSLDNAEPEVDLGAGERQRASGEADRERMGEPEA